MIEIEKQNIDSKAKRQSDIEPQAKIYLKTFIKT